MCVAVVALDCEMCATRDPVSNEQNSKALIRLSVVSGAQGTDEVRGLAYANTAGLPPDLHRPKERQTNRK